MKQLEKYPGYMITDSGKIYKKSDGTEISQVETGIPKYKYVNLYNDQGKRKLVRVHRLVAETFIPNPSNLPIVDHIDRNKFNNHASNLRWIEKKDNMYNSDYGIVFGYNNNLYGLNCYLKDCTDNWHNVYCYINKKLIQELNAKHQLTFSSIVEVVETFYGVTLPPPSGNINPLP